MLSLRNLQQQVAAEILAPDNLLSSRYARSTGLTGVERLRVYRNNVFVSLTEALKACYPVIERLVGKEFFAYAAGVYIRSYPSHSGDLHEYGSQFPGLLRRLPSLTAWPYLPGVAALEWACQEAYHAEDTPPLDIAQLAAVPESAYANVRLYLNATGRLLRSNYPIVRIWQVNQAGYENDPLVDLAEGGVKLLVIRRNYAIEMKPLADGEYIFLQALANGCTVSHAYGLALAQESTFDLGLTLRTHISQGTLNRFLIYRPELHA